MSIIGNFRHRNINEGLGLEIFEMKRTHNSKKFLWTDKNVLILDHYNIYTAENTLNCIELQSFNV